jgi:exopolysaccharide biosynthesis protein
MNLGYQSLIVRAIVVNAAVYTAIVPALSAASVAGRTRRVNGVTAHVVTVNLNDPRIAVRVGLARRGIGHSESMASMMRRLQPEAAITGTFFCTQSLLPVGDIVTSGRRLYSGPAGTGFCVSVENTVRFHPRKYGRTIRWRGCDTVLCTGPTLLRAGRDVLSPRSEGYRDGSLWAMRPRTAVGLTRANKLLFVCVEKPIHLGLMLRVMRSLGCVDALGLDGGSSSALYCKGKMVVRPARRLTNVLMVTRSARPRGTVMARLDRERATRLAQAAHRRGSPDILEALSTSLAVIGR